MSMFTAMFVSVLGWVVVIQFAMSAGIVKVPYTNGFFPWFLTGLISLVLSVAPLIAIILIEAACQHLKLAIARIRDPYHMVRDWSVDP